MAPERSEGTGRIGATGSSRADELLDAILEDRPVDWEALAREGALPASELSALRALARIRRSARQDRASELTRAAELSGGFEIQEQIGSGSFGRVYRAVDRRLGRQVALKISNEELPASGPARQLFLEEARTLARLDHPNIVRVHSVGERGGHIVIVLEFIDGFSLEAIVAEVGPLAPEEAARIGVELCRALAALHAQDLVHRDVKPSNVMRAAGGRIVLLDFGFARSTSRVPSASGRPEGGTPFFMAPEQFEGRGALGPAVDIYALGVVLYWLACGRHPYRAETFEQLREQVLGHRPTPLVDHCPRVSPEYASIVARALAKDPAERFASAGELEEALRRFLSGREGGAQLRDLAEAGRAMDRRTRIPKLAAGALLIAAIGMGSYLAFTGIWAAPSFAVDTQLCIVREGQDVPLTFVSAEPLSDTAVLRLGDSLVLKALGNRDFHLYIFNEDEAGHLFRLFPLSDFDPTNPLPGSVSHRLPGRLNGEPRSWVVDTQGGAFEDFLVIASLGPSEAGEELCKQLPEVIRDEALVLDFRSLSESTRNAVHRGVGATRPEARQPTVAQGAQGAQGGSLSGRLSDLFRTRSLDSEAVRDEIWRAIRVRAE